MDIGVAKIGMKVLQPSTGDVGIIISFKMSESGLNRIYVEIELLDGSVVSRPLDLLCKW